MSEAPKQNSLEDRLSDAISLAFLVIVVINAVVIVFLEGMNWILPDNPTGHDLFRQ